MTHEYYTEFNATLEAHGFEKLAEETIDALSKEAAYYDAFISTCLQQGMTKSAAVTLYKEGGLFELGVNAVKVAPQIIKNLANIGKVRATGKGVWTAVRHPFITNDAIKGSDAAIAAAKTTAGRKNLLAIGFANTKKLNSQEKILNNIVAARGKNIANYGSRAYKNQKLLDTMMATRVRAAPTTDAYLKNVGIYNEPTRVGFINRVGSKVPTANTASTASKATAGSNAAEGAASKATGATPQGTAELKDVAANSTATDASALGAAGTKDTAAITAGIKDKLKAWGPYAFVGGAGYLLGNNGSGNAPVSVAPTIVIPGAGGQGGAYIPGATQNGLMYGYD